MKIDFKTNFNLKQISRLAIVSSIFDTNFGTILKFLTQIPLIELSEISYNHFKTEIFIFRHKFQCQIPSFFHTTSWFCIEIFDTNFMNFKLKFIWFFFLKKILKFEYYSQDSNPRISTKISISNLNFSTQVLGLTQIREFRHKF